MRGRRILEVGACALYVLVMSGAAAETPGSGGRYEEGFAWIGLSALLLVFATVMTIVSRDLRFRLLLYPVALLASFALLLLDIERVYGYGRDHFWSEWPFGEASALVGLGYVLLLDLVVAIGSRLLRDARARRQSRGASGT